MSDLMRIKLNLLALALTAPPPAMLISSPFLSELSHLAVVLPFLQVTKALFSNQRVSYSLHVLVAFCFEKLYVVFPQDVKTLNVRSHQVLDKTYQSHRKIQTCQTVTACCW